MGRAAVAALAALTFVLLVHPAGGALNVAADGGTEDLVRELRRSIFVEAVHLAERPAEKTRGCSSLDGPSCVRNLFGRGTLAAGFADASQTGAAASAASVVLDGAFGVVPDSLLRDLGVAGAEDVGFITPEYSVLEQFRLAHGAAASEKAVPVLAGTSSLEELARARAGVASGVMHFQGLQPDTRLPLSFSRGLPNGVVATWDGRWLVRSCGGGLVAEGAPAATSALPLALPAPAGGELAVIGADAWAPALPSPGQDAGSRDVFSSAELAGSVGYVRFSRPVIVRSLFARWQTPRSSPAVVGGRLGLEPSWTAHLDPARLREAGVAGAWLDIAGPLHPVDEVAFIGALGLEVGAMEVLAPGGEAGDGDDGMRSVLLLAPVDRSVAGAAGDVGASPAFALRVQQVSLTAAPFLASLDEVVQRNLRLVAAPQRARMAPAAAGVAGATPAVPGHVPGLLALPDELPEAARALALAAAVAGADGNLDGEADDTKWLLEALGNEGMFKHNALLPMMQSATSAALVRAAASKHGAPRAEALAVAALDGLTKQLGVGAADLPEDLRRAMPREREEIDEAVLAWVAGGGGWRRRTPSTLPRGGSEEAFALYARAKRLQTKLDLLTAVSLHSQRSRR